MEKTDIILKLIEKPENFTEEQIAEILSDEECLKLYLTVCDVDSMYKASRRSKKKSFVQRYQWAASLAALFVSGIAIAAVSTGFFRHDDGSAGQNENVKSERQVTLAKQTVPSKTTTSNAIRKTFDNATLEDVFAEMARHYGFTVVFEDEKAKQIRIFYEWDSAMPLSDVVKELSNFNKISLSLTEDNEQILLTVK
ncbi:DUF4974 domain-containing protein [Palleniella muris]|uniref:DUF4974 domain-containing protein n=1 Tax=Palleniella muris TaxID=3038145 RepID=A0AC61QU08_9BACT|nr:DUF4974 domain-containing protein [Palleniella muris]TGX83591.1 DUF4974 domain-containing protein [Palleniella muris]